MQRSAQTVSIEGGRAHPAWLWTWEFASRVASGVAACIRDFHYQSRQAFPATPVPPHERQPNKPSDWPCPASC
eukprot:982054-Prorocentrum_lima.AAC.1